MEESALCVCDKCSYTIGDLVQSIPILITCFCIKIWSNLPDSSGSYTISDKQHNFLLLLLNKETRKELVE